MHALSAALCSHRLSVGSEHAIQNSWAEQLLPFLSPIFRGQYTHEGGCAIAGQNQDAIVAEAQNIALILQLPVRLHTQLWSGGILQG